MAIKENFLSFRADGFLFRWIKDYSSKNGISVSDAIREALLDFKLKKDNDAFGLLGDSVSELRSEEGNMFRVVKTEHGVLLERVEPRVVKL